MGARRKARELALQMLFQYDIAGNEPAMILTTFEPLRTVNEETRDFAVRVFAGTVGILEKIDEMIVQQTEHWRISRMAVVDRNIIRMSVYEFLHEPGTPKLVVMNEAIEIAKSFGSEKSGQFVNGILDGILKRYNLHDEKPSRDRGA
jgi:transcription antitermination protein NusB